MTSSFPSSLSHRDRFWRYLCLGLAGTIAAPAFGMSLHSRSVTPSEARPHCSKYQSQTPQSYLLVLGPASFRFAKPAPVATERPASAVPSLAAAVTVTSTVTSEKTAGTNSAVTTAGENRSGTNDASTFPKALPILPDDTPRDVHAEDVLPFFQLPRGDNSDRPVSMPFTPAAPTLPKSSATYELK